MAVKVNVNKNNHIFQRYEKKYILNMQQYEQFLKRVSSYLEVDQYGESTICNLYYDTASYELIRTSIEKPEYKEKLRLRSYGIPEEGDTAFIEIKKKYDGIVYKRRIELAIEQAAAYLDEGMEPDLDSQIKREIDYCIQFYDLSKKMYIAYDRTAMYGIYDDSVRVTFDKRIRYRMNDLELQKGDHGIYILPEDKVLMEIKVAGAYPLWMTEILSDLAIYPGSFSKYGNSYKKEQKEKRITFIENAGGQDVY